MKYVSFKKFWESKHGPVPKGYEILYKDGNPLNNSFDNLYYGKSRYSTDG